MKDNTEIKCIVIGADADGVVAARQAIMKANDTLVLVQGPEPTPYPTRVPIVMASVKSGPANDGKANRRQRRKEKRK